MAITKQHKATGNILLHLRPFHRVLISLAVASIVFFCIRNSGFNGVLTATMLWISFALTFNITSWIVFFKLPVGAIVKKANSEDGSRVFVMISVLISSFASMFMVLLLMISKQPDLKNAPQAVQDAAALLEKITVAASISGMIVSWILVHTIFTFHYAFMYYFKEKDDTPGGEALNFPGKDKPDYLDFAYFSFIIGMTFQVSDVEISSAAIRRTALAHSLLSFALNTFVVALTINLIAGLKG